MSHKQRLGQFFTTNSDFILQGFEKYVCGKTITDPFAGKGDLLAWAQRHGAKSASGYDIDPHYADGKLIRAGDSLAQARAYDFVLTNPPYLYQNKMRDNSLLKNSKHTDLYQLALEKLLNTQEGIAIVPINFLSAENSQYIRELFLDRFNLIKANYFTGKVFNDTTYNVIAFYFHKKHEFNDSKDRMKVEFTFYPEEKNTEILLEKRYNWQIGGDFLANIKAQKNSLGIQRLEEDDLEEGAHELTIAHNHISNKRKIRVSRKTHEKLLNNIILLKSIDTGRASAAGDAEGRICLEDLRKHNCSGLVSIKTSRNQISLIFPDFVSIQEQEKLIETFNRELEAKRRAYHSLFMTNFRDKDRKRISFNFVYKFINFLYQKEALSKLGEGHAASAEHGLFEPVARQP